jgi:pyruvate dehydrogenase E2 component (dihydrolipoamide acetyltransferase)
MIRDIFMPALSSTMTEGKIVSWVKSPGEKVSKGETVLVVESDKADMDVESFYDGYLAVILVEAGQEAPVGEAIAYIAETEAEIELAKAFDPRRRR